MSSPNPLPIQLTLSRYHTSQGLPYQQLEIELTQSDRIIAPEDLVDLELPAGIDTTQGVVITGRAPIWLYAYLVHECHPTAWVACFDPRLGAVVVSTHSRQAQVGQVISLEASEILGGGRKLCPALLVVGPPDSGKSVLSHALFQSLVAVDSQVYLQRAQWDGEGNYILELGEESGHTEADIEALRAVNRGQLTDRFFPYHARAILQLRQQKSLVIVDVGGMVQPEKLPLLEACTHYLIISSKPEAVEPWHEFCRDRGNLSPVGVIHSTLTTCETIHQQEPFLEITCGAWVRGQGRSLPESLLQKVKALLLKRG